MECQQNCNRNQPKQQLQKEEPEGSDPSNNSDVQLNSMIS